MIDTIKINLKMETKKELEFKQLFESPEKAIEHLNSINKKNKNFPQKPTL